MQIQPKTMSNLQLELLKLYARDVSDADLDAIRHLIGLYFAEKATIAMDNYITANNLTPQDLGSMVYEHWRSKNRT
jgi:phosphoenolpyruvate-protein kinase (PTS system EI component)